MTEEEIEKEAKAMWWKPNTYNPKTREESFISGYLACAKKRQEEMDIKNKRIQELEAGLEYVGKLITASMKLLEAK